MDEITVECVECGHQFKTVETRDKYGKWDVDCEKCGGGTTMELTPEGAAGSAGNGV